MPLGGNDTPCLCGPLHAFGALWASPLRVRFAPSSRLGASHPSEVLPGCVQPGVGGAGWVRASNHPAPWPLDQPHKMPVCPGRQASFRFATHIGGSQFNGTDNRRVDQTRRWWGGRASNPHLHSLAQPRACECRSFPDELPSHIGPQRASASVTRWPSSRPPPSPSPPRGRTSPE